MYFGLLCELGAGVTTEVGAVFCSVSTVSMVKVEFIGLPSSGSSVLTELSCVFEGGFFDFVIVADKAVLSFALALSCFHCSMNRLEAFPLGVGLAAG